MLVSPLMIFTGTIGRLWPELLGSIFHSELGIKIAGGALSVVWFLAYVAYLIIGIGLWKLKNRVRKAVLVICFLVAICGVVAGIIAGLHHPLIALACMVWSVSLCVWQAWYLMRPRVRYAFGDWRKYTPAGEWIAPPALSKRGRIVVGIALPATTIGLFVTSLFFGIDSMMRSSEAYRMSMSAAQSSPCVVTLLGTPLHSGFISGNYDESSERGSAEYDFSVEGPKGKGYLSVEAKKSQGKWILESLVFSHNAHDM